MRIHLSALRASRALVCQLPRPRGRGYILTALRAFQPASVAAAELLILEFNLAWKSCQISISAFSCVYFLHALCSDSTTV
jgi:hypothetical protein